MIKLTEQVGGRCRTIEFDNVDDLIKYDNDVPLVSVESVQNVTPEVTNCVPVSKPSSRLLIEFDKNIDELNAGDTVVFEGIDSDYFIDGEEYQVLQVDSEDRYNFVLVADEDDDDYWWGITATVGAVYKIIK